MPVTRVTVQPVITMKEKKDRASPFIVKWKDASKCSLVIPPVTSVMADNTEVPSAIDVPKSGTVCDHSAADAGMEIQATDFNANDKSNGTCSAFRAVHSHTGGELDNSDQCNANTVLSSDTVDNMCTHNENKTTLDNNGLNKVNDKLRNDTIDDRSCQSDLGSYYSESENVQSNKLPKKDNSSDNQMENRHFHSVCDDSDDGNETEKVIQDPTKSADEKKMCHSFVNRSLPFDNSDITNHSNVDLSSTSPSRRFSGGNLKSDPGMNNDRSVTSTKQNDNHREYGPKMTPGPNITTIYCGSAQSHMSPVSADVGSTLSSSCTSASSATNNSEPVNSQSLDNEDVTNSKTNSAFVHPDTHTLPTPTTQAFQPQQFPQASASLSDLPSLPSPPIFTIQDSQKPPIDDEEACIIEMRILQKAEPPNGAPPPTERCDSQLSTLSEKMDICRICHCEGEENNKLISPCLCSGSLKYMHLACLQKWIKSSDKKACELCSFDYIMTTKIRPFKQWERLEMSSAERRKIVCSVTFHIIAITCVIWSLYVLIDRTSEEVNSGTLDWPFWTKLIVVAIGFTGGLVFMYVQCKMYVQLCLRWRSFNKLINIENAPEDADVRAEAAARIKARSGEQGGVVNTIAIQEMNSF